MSIQPAPSGQGVLSEYPLPTLPGIPMDRESVSTTTSENGSPSPIGPGPSSYQPPIAAPRMKGRLQMSALNPARQGTSSSEGKQSSSSGTPRVVHISGGEARQGPAVPAILEALNWLEHTQIRNYIRIFDISRPNLSIQDVLRERHRGQLVTCEDMGEGVTGTQKIRVNNVAQYILKRNALPESLFSRNWDSVLERFEESGRGDLAGKVRFTFVETPRNLLPQDFPYFNNIQREKLAYVIGRRFGVPRTEVIQAQDGYFSLHQFTPNVGSAARYGASTTENQRKLSLQNLQDIGILDVLLDSHDRNGGNMVVERTQSSYCCCCKSEVLGLVPVDHALTYQKMNFLDSAAAGEIFEPYWMRWAKAGRELTRHSKQKIRELNATTAIREAQEAGLVLDRHVETRITQNVAFLQRAIRENPRLTLRRLHAMSLALRPLG